VTHGDDLGVNSTLRVRATHADWIAIVGQVMVAVKRQGNEGPTADRARELCGMIAIELHHRLRLPREIVEQWGKDLRVTFPDGRRTAKKRNTAGPRYVD
jgi:hypothetical protein